MKNKKFNKSKVIVPALAVIALTTTASVTSTVAWFTANRAVSATAAQFQATNTSSSLSIALGDTKSANITAGAATATSNAVTVSGLLADASYDFTKVYTKTLDDAGNVTGYKDVTDANDTGIVVNGKKVYYYASWQWVMTLNNPDTAHKFGLFSDAAFTAPTSGDDVDAATGFRVALKSSVTTHNVVYANGETKTHITAKDVTTPGSASTGDFSTDTDTQFEHVNATLPDAIKDYSDTDTGYLGDFTMINGSGEITVTCTAWFEGTDASVSNAATAFTAVTSSFNFYVRETAIANS